MKKSLSSKLLDYTKKSPTIQDQQKIRKLRKVRKQPEDFLSIPGVKKITLSKSTQKALSCSVGENVTIENAWTRITKETLEYEMEAREETCELVVFKDQIMKYEGEDLLIGYIPDETKDYDEFLICLTKVAASKVNEIIKRQKDMHEERLRNSVFKSVKPWRSCGSERDIIDIRPNRLTLQVELDGEYPPLGSQQPYKLRIITAKPAANTYADLLPLRLNFANISKRLIECAAQVTPYATCFSTQSVSRYPKHNTTQYEYIAETDKNVTNHFKEFMDNNMDELNKYLTIGSNINLYADDYCEMRHSKFARLPESMQIKEYLSISYLSLPIGMGVSGVVFHPTWSSTIAVMYSFLPRNLYRRKDCHKDLVDNATFHVPPVLIWSFVDVLKPTLILETPSEITCLAFCPHNENLLVGGCASGQTIVWDLTNKLTKAETHEVLSADQEKYRILMQSLTPWLKNTNNVRVVRETITSNLNYSHTAPVSSISWLNPFHEFNTRGRITEIPEDQNHASMQFVSSGKDGNIFVWDLNAKPKYSVEQHKTLPSKSKLLKIRPAALTVDVSPYRILHRIMIPKFRIGIVQPGTFRPLPLTAIKLQKFPIEYVEQHSIHNQKYSFFNRIMFKPVLVNPKVLPKHEFIAGTLEGDCILMTWSGFNIHSGQIIPKEMCKIENIAKYHDGAIASVSRSMKYQDLILTVGGKVFALWHINFMRKPVIWRRSRENYTHGRFDTLIPSRICLVRKDGFMEVWDFLARSNSMKVGGSLSRYPLTCSIAQIRNLAQNYFITGDERGCCRAFLISRLLSCVPENEQSGTYEICLRELKRKEILLQWQSKWRTNHTKETQLKEECIRRREEKHEEEIKTGEFGCLSKKNKQSSAKVSESSILEPPQPGKYTEWAHKKYLLNQKIHNNKLLLKSKSLDMEVLEKQRKPVIEFERQAQKNAYRLQQYSQGAESKFIAGAKQFLPDRVAKHIPISTDPHAYVNTDEDKSEIYKRFQEIKEESDKYVTDRPLKHVFSWQTTLNSGKKRRKYLDGYYSRYNHDIRFKRQQRINRVWESPGSSIEIVVLHETGRKV